MTRISFGGHSSNQHHRKIELRSVPDLDTLIRRAKLMQRAAETHENEGDLTTASLSWIAHVELQNQMADRLDEMVDVVDSYLHR